MREFQGDVEIDRRTDKEKNQSVRERESNIETALRVRQCEIEEN